MAESSRNGVVRYLPEVGIPVGLNRIKTRRVVSRGRVSAGGGESEQFNESPGGGIPASRSCVKQKPKAVYKGVVKDEGFVKFFHPKEGLCKGKKKIAQWFASSLFKDSDQALADFPRKTKSTLHFNTPDTDRTKRKLRKMQKKLSRKEAPDEITSTERVPKDLKSFSHELGPIGGIYSLNPRAHSFNDLKELLGSLHSRFDAAKEVVNGELNYFLGEMMDILREADFIVADEYKMAEELFILAQQCISMTSLNFRTKCEEIVQDLTEKRLKCHSASLKALFTRILFILTRCTRLLYFDKDSGPAHERSLGKVMECLERIPYVDKNWVSKSGLGDSETFDTLKRNEDVNKKFQEKDGDGFSSWTLDSVSEVAIDKQDGQLGMNMSIGKKIPASNLQPNLLSDVDRSHNTEAECLINSEQGNFSDDSNLVMCRICEELVPSVHLEPHSYICAYADKCISKHLYVDERLLKLVELMEYFLELCNPSNHGNHVNPEILRFQTANSPITWEKYSTKCTAWRSKGMDGMLEDLHEMDTAGIEDSHRANLKSHFGKTINHYGPSSSNGSTASTSSTSSPRSGIFDLFRVDQNNLTEQEDIQQIIELADIARCVAGTNLSENGSHEFLLDCMQDLQDILQCSNHKALLVDIFGGRVESLLREKYLLACNLVDDVSHPESSRSLRDSASQSSTTSTPSHPTHKQRTSIDDFDIIKPISRGAYGKVFLARKRTTGDLFAIKVLKKLDILRKNDVERILAERNILITVRNPFVVRFFYSFTSTDNLYLVMEFLNGGDLYSLLRKVGCLEEAVARTYIAELVLALEYLHSLGVVHRDLKPDNILIAHDGHIKLTDFGLSKIGLMNCTSDLSVPDIGKVDVLGTHDLHNIDSEDSRQSAVGTPDYLAPEILLGTQHGYAADWWSVGIILFELITGIPPFTGDHPEIIFDNILNRKIPWPSVPRDMSTEAQDLTDRLLFHDSNLRLGAKGASEVKAHSFFSGVDWDNLALQKAAFVPQPDGIDDTSYFVSRYNSTGREVDEISIDLTSDSSESLAENIDECGDLAEFNPSPLDLSLMNFSFKNLSQLASINHDVLVQSGKDSSSPCKDSPNSLGT